MSRTYNQLALAASALMFFNTVDTLYTCLAPSGACGTPCASASFCIVVSPVLLVPFVPLLWAKNLVLEGLVARCAVTCAGATWAVALAVLIETQRLWL